MCQRIGLPPTSTIGLGRRSVSSDNRVPRPPARMTVFMSPLLPEGTGRPRRAPPAQPGRHAGSHGPGRSSYSPGGPDRARANTLRGMLAVAPDLAEKYDAAASGLVVE